LTASSKRTRRGSAACSRCPPSGPRGSGDGPRSPPTAKTIPRPDNAVLVASPAAPKTGCSVVTRETAMDIHSPVIAVVPERVAELERLGDQIAELSAHLEAAGARLLDLIRAFDARGGWNTGFRTCADWLSWRVGLAPGAARERVRVARALGTLPLLAQALARGELSYAKVRALTRVATPEDEERLLGVGRGGTAAQVERIVRGWRRVDRQAEAKESARQHASRALRVYEDEDGTVVVRGRLAPEVGALLRQALACVQKGRRVQRESVPAGARARRPVAWMAGRRETEALEPIDEAIKRMVSESPGCNVSERVGSPDIASPGGRAHAKGAKAAGTVAVWLTRRIPSGGVGATAR